MVCMFELHCYTVVLCGVVAFLLLVAICVKTALVNLVPVTAVHYEPSLAWEMTLEMSCFIFWQLNGRFKYK